jgi:hypothetical protein
LSISHYWTMEINSSATASSAIRCFRPSLVLISFLRLSSCPSSMHCLLMLSVDITTLCPSQGFYLKILLSWYQLVLSGVLGALRAVNRHLNIVFLIGLLACLLSLPLANFCNLLRLNALHGLLRHVIILHSLLCAAGFGCVVVCRGGLVVMLG